MAKQRKGAPGVARGEYDEGRSQRVEVLASPAEVRAWRAAAKREGVTVGAWVRAACAASAHGQRHGDDGPGPE